MTRYPTTCNACKQDLTQPSAVRVCSSSVTAHRSRLNDDGTAVIDEQMLGYVLCGNCDHQIDEVEFDAEKERSDAKRRVELRRHLRRMLGEQRINLQSEIVDMSEDALTEFCALMLTHTSLEILYEPPQLKSKTSVVKRLLAHLGRAGQKRT